jgi:hypothetical protein
MFITVRINTASVAAITVHNMGPIDGVYAEGDEPGGDGVRVYSWQAEVEPWRDRGARRRGRDCRHLAGEVLHARADGATALSAKVLGAVSAALDHCQGISSSGD